MENRGPFELPRRKELFNDMKTAADKLRIAHYMMFGSAIHYQRTDEEAERLGHHDFDCIAPTCQWKARLERLTGAENAGDEGKWSVRYPSGRGALNHNHPTQRPRRPRIGHMVGLVKKYKIADDLWEPTPPRAQLRRRRILRSQEEASDEEYNPRENDDENEEQDELEEPEEEGGNEPREQRPEIENRGGPARRRIPSVIVLESDEETEVRPNLTLRGFLKSLSTTTDLLVLAGPLRKIKIVGVEQLKGHARRGMDQMIEELKNLRPPVGFGHREGLRFALEDYLVKNERN